MAREQVPIPVPDVPAEFKDWIAQLVRDEVKKALQDAGNAEFLSTAEASAFARVSPDTLRRWVKEGKLTTGHAGRELRFRRKDLEGLMTSGTGRARVQRSRRAEALTPEEIAARDWGRKRA